LGVVSLIGRLVLLFLAVVLLAAAVLPARPAAARPAPGPAARPPGQATCSDYSASGIASPAQQIGQIPWGTLYAGDNSRSYETWFYLSATGGTYDIMTYNAASVLRIISGQLYSDGQATGITPSVNTWHHIASVFLFTPPATRQIILYYDGGQYGPWNRSSWLPAAAGTFNLGATVNTLKLNESAVYNSALSLSQVHSHYNATTLLAYRSAVLANTPAVFVGLDETSTGLAMVDNSGNGQHGVYNSSAVVQLVGKFPGTDCPTATPTLTPTVTNTPTITSTPTNTPTSFPTATRPPDPEPDTYCTAAGDTWHYAGVIGPGYVANLYDTRCIRIYGTKATNIDYWFYPSTPPGPDRFTLKSVLGSWSSWAQVQEGCINRQGFHGGNCGRSMVSHTGWCPTLEDCGQLHIFYTYRVL
jgi:hypothetical protein